MIRLTSAETRSDQRYDVINPLATCSIIICAAMLRIGNRKLLMAISAASIVICLLLYAVPIKREMSNIDRSVPSSAGNRKLLSIVAIKCLISYTLLLSSQTPKLLYAVEITSA